MKEPLNLSCWNLGVCLALLLCKGSHSSTPVWGPWHVEDLRGTLQLSNSTITTIARVGERHIYLATPTSIFVYDGSHIEEAVVPWDVADHPPTRRVIQFFTDSAHNVYFASTNDGIFRASPEGNSFEAVEAPSLEEWTRGRALTAVATVGPNTTAYIIGGDAYYHRLNSGLVFPVPLGGANLERTVVSLDSRRDHKLTVLTSDGHILFLVAAEAGYILDKVYDCGALLPSPQEILVSGGDDSRFFVIDGAVGLIELHGSDGSCVPRQSSLASTISSMGAIPTQMGRLDAKFAVAIGTDKGLFIESSDGVVWLSSNNSALRSDEIVALEPISDRGLIVGTLLGFTRITKRDHTRVLNFPNDVTPEILAVARHRELGTLVATRDALFLEKPSASGITFKEINLASIHRGFSSLSATSDGIAVGHRDGTITWLGINNGNVAELTDSWNIGSGYGVNLSTMHEVTGSRLLVGTYGSGVYVAAPGTSTNLELLGADSADDMKRIIDIVQLKTGDFVVVSITGAYNIGSPENWDLSGTDSVSSARIRWRAPRVWCIRDSEQGVIAAYPDGKIVRLDSSTGQLRNVILEGEHGAIFSLEVDDAGKIWIATKSGIRSLNPSGLVDDFVTVSSASPLSFEYDTSEIDRANALYFGGIGGLLKIPLRGKVESTGRPELYVSGIVVDQRKWGLGGEVAQSITVELPYRNSNLSIVLNLFEPAVYQLMSVRYRLEGFQESNASTTTQNEITYTNLPPGDYVFSAKGADSNGVWSRNEVRLPITVLPPWWQTWPAYVLYAVSALVLFFLLKRANENRTLRAARDDLELQVHLAQEREVDELQAHIESTTQMLERIEARTFDILDCMEDFLAVEVAADHAGSAASGARMADRLTAMRTLQSVITMVSGEAVADLSEYTHVLLDQLTASRARYAPNVITVNNVTGRPVPAEHAVYLAVVLRELLENVFDHAFSKTFQGAVLSVTLGDPESDGRDALWYRVLVEDNGRGLPDEDVGGSTAQGGLALVSRIAERFDGALQLEDIGGTRVTVTLRMADPGV